MQGPMAAIRLLCSIAEKQAAIIEHLTRILRPNQWTDVVDPQLITELRDLLKQARHEAGPWDQEGKNDG